MESTQNSKTHLEQLLDQISPSFCYSFEDGYLRIENFGENCIDNIQTFTSLLEQNSTLIIRLVLASNLINVLNINISILLVNWIGDEGIKYVSQSLQ
jgi:hypothetical protein